MAVRYARSTDGSDADGGSTWALAKATLAGLAAIDTAGDTLWLSQAHAESTAGAVSIALAGTLASPAKVLCGDDSAQPPTALATTATVTATGGNNITLGNSLASYHFWYGIGFICGTGTGSQTLAINGIGRFEACSFQIASTGASGSIDLNNDSGHTALKDCTFKFAASGQGLKTNSSGGQSIPGKVQIMGGSLLAGGTSPANLFVALAAGAQVALDGFDLSNAGSSTNIFASGVTNQNVRATLRDCKLPGSWSGSLHAGTPGSGSVFELFNCDAGDTHYTYRKHTQLGTIRDETTLVRTGGASDGTTTYSLKLESNANAEHPLLTLDTPEMIEWNDTVGSSVTATVEFLHDSATALKDNEIWLEVMYLGTSGVPLASFISDGISVVATAADQADSSETWTTTGMSNPNTRKLSVTFTPQEVGFIHAVVKVAKASTTVYVDPQMTLT